VTPALFFSTHKYCFNRVLLDNYACLTNVQVEAGLDKIAKQITVCTAQYEAVSTGFL